MGRHELICFDSNPPNIVTKQCNRVRHDVPMLSENTIMHVYYTKDQETKDKKVCECQKEEGPPRPQQNKVCD